MAPGDIFGDDSDDSSDSDSAPAAAIANANNSEEKATEDDAALESNSNTGNDAAAPESKEDGNNSSSDSDHEFDGGKDVAGREMNEDERQEMVQLQKQHKAEDRFGGIAANEDDNQDKQQESSSSNLPPAKPQPKLTVLDIAPPVSPANVDKVHLHMTKLPNIVNINPEPYDRDTYDPEEEEKEYRGYVHNMIRWRYQRDKNSGDVLRDERGKLQRESNTRVVKWSDGSLTLHVGTETFEIDELPKPQQQQQKSQHSNAQFPGLNGYLYLSQKATYEDDKPAGTVLECMGPIRSKFTPKPSIKSEAHKNMTLAIRQKNIKKTRIAEYVTQVDPDKVKDERIRNREDIHRSRSGGGRRGRRQKPKKFYPGGDDAGGNYDTMSIGGLRRRVEEHPIESYGNGNNPDSDDDDAWTKRKRFKKGGRASSSMGRHSDDEDDDDDDVVGGQDSDDEEDFNLNKRRKARGKVFDDDD